MFKSLMLAFWSLLISIAVELGIAGFMGVFVWLAWGFVMPHLGLPSIDFLQATMLVFIAGLVFNKAQVAV